MLVKVLLLDTYFYDININLSKYRMAGSLFNFEYFSFKDYFSYKDYAESYEIKNVSSLNAC